MNVHRASRALGLCLLGGFVLLFGACSALERGRDQTTQKNLLEAGFHKYPAGEFSGSQDVSNLPENTLSQVNKPDGPIFYFPLNQSVFVGGPAQASAYQNILVRARAKMATDAAERMVVRNRPIPAP